MIVSNTIHNENIELYRIMPLERFLQMLTNHRNVLVKPFSWNDPFESLIKTASIKDQNGDEYPFDESRWYGQCWTESPESDALWQVFTKSKIARGVKIKTTSSLLKESLLVEELEDDKVFFLERVKYAKQSEDETVMDALTNTYSFEWGFEENYNTLLFNERFKDDLNIMGAPLLLTKRFAFQHEKEVRLLCYCKGNQEGSTYTYEIANWKNFIEEVELDPWTPKGVDEALSDILLQYDIRKKDGSPMRATISKLYQDCKANIVYSPKF